MNKIESALVSNEFICREIECQATIIRRIEQEIRKMRINPDRTVESWAVNLEKCLKRQKEILSAYSELYCRRMEKTETFVNPLTVAYCPPQPVQITKLLNTIYENPGLPVVCKVSSDVGNFEEYESVLAQIEDVKIEKFCQGPERIIVKGDYDKYEAVQEYLGYEKALAMNDEEIAKAYDDIPWTEHIAVYIGA